MSKSNHGGVRVNSGRKRVPWSNKMKRIPIIDGLDEAIESLIADYKAKCLNDEKMRSMEAERNQNA